MRKRACVCEEKADATMALACHTLFAGAMNDWIKRPLTYEINVSKLSERVSSCFKWSPVNCEKSWIEILCVFLIQAALNFQCNGPWDCSSLHAVHRWLDLKTRTRHLNECVCVLVLCYCISVDSYKKKEVHEQLRALQIIQMCLVYQDQRNEWFLKSCVFLRRDFTKWSDASFWKISHRCTLKEEPEPHLQSRQ